MSFFEHLCPAPIHGGFEMSKWWIWGGSPIRAEDGRYHLFASRWPKRLPFLKSYPFYSEIVRADADTAEGPYTFCEVVLPSRGEAYWDGRMTHNPAIIRRDNIYLLYYIGATYQGDPPERQELLDPNISQRRNCSVYQIGLATSDSIFGPWRRYDEPVLTSRPGKWDDQVITNPAPCLLDDDSVLLVYRSNTPEGLRLGAAQTVAPDKPFQRIRDDPIFQLEGGGYVEDPFIWRSKNGLEMIAKDWTGRITKEQGAGVHAMSENNGTTWRLAKSPKAYSRRVVWNDGAVTFQGHLERPQLLIDDAGRPTHLFTATGDGTGNDGCFDDMTRTWNMVTPLACD